MVTLISSLGDFTPTREPAHTLYGGFGHYPMK